MTKETFDSPTHYFLLRFRIGKLHCEWTIQDMKKYITNSILEITLYTFNKVLSSKKGASYEHNNSSVRAF